MYAILPPKVREQAQRRVLLSSVIADENPRIRREKKRPAHVADWGSQA